jgi:hypothetical protein
MKLTRSAWLTIPWIIFIAAALAWVAYWFFLASQIEGRLADWARDQSARGVTVSYAPPTRHGFPVLMRLELGVVRYAPANGGWRAETPRLDLHVNVLNPYHLIVKSEAPITVTRADGAVTTIQADALIASVRTANGALQQAGIEADNLRLDDPAKEGELTVRKLIANVRPDSRATDQYQLAFDVTGMTLPRPVRSFEQFGLDVDTMHAAIVVEHGAALIDNDEGDPLGPWREAGGSLRFEALAFEWGPVAVAGDGQGGLDAERRLQGALSLPIEQPAPIFRALSQSPDASESTRRALGLLAAGYALSGDDITLDIEAASGVLRLEGLPVRTLPPVY